MSEKNNIKIRDFDLFHEVVKTALKYVESATFNVNQNGMQIYGAHERIARCELMSNAIYSDSDIAFSIMDLNSFSRVLQTIQQVHENDYTELTMTVNLPHVKFSSKKFTTKLNTIDPEKISAWTSKKFSTPLKPVFEFNTTSDLIKRLLNQTFIFGENQKDIRVYLEQHNDRENNALFALLGNKENDLNNEMLLKLGIATNGSLGTRTVVLDIPRMNMFGSIPATEIKISLMDLNVLVSKATLVGKNDSWFNLTVYCGILKG